MKTTDDFYSNQKEPQQSCLIALRDIILSQDKEISHTLKYGMPSFCYKGKVFCYLWIHKKMQQPYILIVEGKYFDEPFLIQENRSRMKIMLIDPDEDIPVGKILTILQKALDYIIKAASNK
jgi:hypothetical protein